MNCTRRSFFGAAGAVAAGLAFSETAALSAQETPKAREPKFELGVASYSFRNFNVDQLINWCKKAEIKKVTLKEMHLSLKSTDEECAAMAKKFKDAGLEIYSCGVVYMSKQEDVDNAFRYAKALGCVSIVGVPDWSLLPYAEQKVKETGILLAIHNHGPEDKRYPTAQEMYAMSFAALIHGGNGITWFKYGADIGETGARYSGMFRTQEDWCAMTNITHRIARMSPILLERTPVQPPPAEIVSGPKTDAFGKPSVTLLMKVHRKARYVFAVNAVNEPVRARFSIGGAKSAKVAVAWERREIAMSGDSFEDDFGAYGVHVYRVAGR